MQIKDLTAKQESKVKEPENQIVHEDSELEKEKNKIRILQSELENLKHDYNSKIIYLESQIETKENEVNDLKTKEKGSLELRNQISNLEKRLKEKELKPQEKELLKSINEIVRRFIMGPFGYAWEIFNEEEIDRYYKEFEAKDFSQFSPEIAQYGRFFSSQLRVFKSNVSTRKTDLRKINELEKQKQQLEQNNQASLSKVVQLDKERKEKTDEYHNLAKQLDESNNRVKQIDNAKLELEVTLKQEQKKLAETKDIQIKDLINQMSNKDGELEKERNKIRLLQSEIENLRNDYNADKAKTESQIIAKEKENLELKNQVINIKKKMKEEELNSQEKELLQRMDEIIIRFVTGPFGNAWEFYNEEEIDRYYEEFEAKDFSQFSPEIELYGKFFLSQLRFFRYNLSMLKTKPRTIEKEKSPSKEPPYINKNFLVKRNDKFWTSFFFILYNSPYFKGRDFSLINDLNNCVVSENLVKEKKIRLLEIIKDESVCTDIIKFLFHCSDVDITEEDEQKVKAKIHLAYDFYPRDIYFTV